MKPLQVQGPLKWVIPFSERIDNKGRAHLIGSEVPLTRRLCTPYIVNPAIAVPAHLRAMITSQKVCKRCLQILAVRDGGKIQDSAD